MPQSAAARLQQQEQEQQGPQHQDQQMEPSPSAPSGSVADEAKRHLHADFSRVAVFDAAGTVVYSNCKARCCCKTTPALQACQQRRRIARHPAQLWRLPAQPCCCPAPCGGVLQVLPGEAQALTAAFGSREAAIQRGLWLEGRRYEVGGRCRT